MCLREAGLPAFVDSGRHSIVARLEIPALNQSIRHDRISGFWHLSWLKAAAPGLSIFVQNGGQMRLIIGLPLGDDTYDEIIAASRSLEAEAYRELIRREFFDRFWQNPTFHDVEARRVLEQLVATNALEMKILPEVGAARRPEHGKLQVYYDECASECWVQYSGSKNDSRQGDLGGADFMAVARSWVAETELRAGFEEYFRARWSHRNAVSLGETGTAAILERLRLDEEGIRTRETTTIATARALVAQQAGSNAVLLCPPEWLELLRAEAERLGVHTTDLAVLPVGEPKVFVVLGHFLDEKPIGAMATSPSQVTSLQGLWDGPRIRLWMDASEYSHEPAAQPVRIIFKKVLTELGVPVRQTNRIYTYHHPAGPQPHQIQALNLWQDNGFRGVFEHATGTFKTATGLTAAGKYLFEQCDQRLVIVSAPHISIAQNWWIQARRDFNPSETTVLRAWSEDPSWRDLLDHYADTQRRILAVFVNDSLWRPDWWPVLSAFGGSWALIADEVHNWVSDQRASRFMAEAPAPTHRLGLSAQVADTRQPETAEPIMSWFARNPLAGVHRFDMRQALERGFLRPYDYEVRIVDFTGLSAMTLGIAPVQAYTLSKAEQAATAAVELSETHNRVLVYTGPTKKDARSMTTAIRKRLPLGVSHAVDSFTSDEPSGDRSRILSDFGKGATRVLVAIRCLDEGVDLPIADAAVMALANEDDRQWIQRRGRILRKASANDDSAARIVDFVPRRQSVMADEVAAIASAQAERIRTFARLATLRSREMVVSTLTEAGW
jgi:superfamily II DNA or RNA helicase